MTRTTTRLYRSKNDRMVSGVCGGIAQYFGIDPIIPRLLFVFLALNGSGVLFYLILSIVIPSESRHIAAGDAVGDAPGNEAASVAGSPRRDTLRDGAEELGQRAREMAESLRGAVAGASRQDAAARQEAPRAAESAPAPEARLRLPETQPEGQRSTMLSGILIALGVWILLENLGLSLFAFWNWSLLWPALLILAGVMLFIRRNQQY